MTVGFLTTTLAHEPAACGTCTVSASGPNEGRCHVCIGTEGDACTNSLGSLKCNGTD